MAKYVTDRRLYVNADRSKVVEEDDPEAAFLLVAKGHEVDPATVKQYGLTPPKDKAVKRSENKGAATGSAGDEGDGGPATGGEEATGNEGEQTQE